MKYSIGRQSLIVLSNLRLIFIHTSDKTGQHIIVYLGSLTTWVDS